MLKYKSSQNLYIFREWLGLEGTILHLTTRTGYYKWHYMIWKCFYSLWVSAYKQKNIYQMHYECFKSYLQVSKACRWSSAVVSGCGLRSSLKGYAVSRVRERVWQPLSSIKVTKTEKKETKRRLCCLSPHIFNYY